MPTTAGRPSCCGADLRPPGAVAARPGRPSRSLHRLRPTTLETLHDAALRRGRHGERATQPERLTAARPLRERFYDRLMPTLYRGRTRSVGCGTCRKAGPEQESLVRLFDVLAPTTPAGLDHGRR
ncbi:BTAD domain-containing putative transcriptional regulator [Streptomyces sp. NPDC046557]|uniref:BTAD domain-containing putative transcriptional regulator n=1 Tax=Streptomyces sp. NPDC046557 TaxID=3155372 RepID=UPI0034083DDC